MSSRLTITMNKILIIQPKIYLNYLSKLDLSSIELY